MRKKERFELAQAQLNLHSEHDPDPENWNQWGNDNQKKRGYKPPLINEDKRNKVLPNAMNKIISHFLTNSNTEGNNEDKDEDEVARGTRLF